MSHFYVLVIGDNIDEQLAPFNEQDPDYMTETENEGEDDEYKYNPDAKWDWYEIGGRWSETLLSKSGQYVDQLPKSDLDLLATQAQARDRAYKLFDAYAQAFAGKEIPKWDDTVQQAHGLIDAARTAYTNHPVVKAINELDESYRQLAAPYLLPWGQCLHELFHGGDREAMADAAAFTAGVPYAVLKDGEWYEKGSMGWFGVSTNEDADWAKKFHELLAATDDDALLTVVDCHI
jgi:hypothetical protein